ncbi:MAG: prephenate dehydratase domain-containing protein [Thermoplasmata archaeon]|nr:prephenate dehydratase domain-containing protein [Thermoplasmata archaeon]
MVIRVAYMGIPGSNSEQAAVELAGAMGWDVYALIPKEDSRNTVAALDSGEADYGVVASRNVTAGPVEETEISLGGRDDIEILRALWLPIHHCVFVRRPAITVKHVASHIQALLQTREHLDALYPDADRVEVSDTAVAAEMLADGRLSEDTAVVCRRNAGEMFKLLLVHENIEDMEGNMTEFELLRLKR